MAREIGGPDFLVVTPGVRPTWARPTISRAPRRQRALAEGASHIVCGRPITAAADPRAAALAVVEEMAAAEAALPAVSVGAVRAHHALMRLDAGEHVGGGRRPRVRRGAGRDRSARAYEDDRPGAR